MSDTARQWRLLDTGVRPAAENMAFNRALLEGRQSGVTPPTLRFLRFEPCALLGFHQDAAQELDLGYCRNHGIQVQRRLTGGGAIYFDRTQLGWELYLDKQVFGTGDMTAIARQVCEAAADGMRRLGVDARYRPRNDIEVDGRKLSGTGGAFDGDAVLYQGTLLIDYDVEHMFRALRIPAEKISDKAIADAQARVVNLRELLGDATPDIPAIQQEMAAAFGEAFGVEVVPGPLLDNEQELFQAALTEIDRDEWVYHPERTPPREEPLRQAAIKTQGGLIRVSLRLDSGGRRVSQIWFHGDFFVRPQRLIWDLEGHLRGTPVSEVPDRIAAFFAEAAPEMLMLGPEDFGHAVAAALESEPRTLDEALP